MISKVVALRDRWRPGTTVEIISEMECLNRGVLVAIILGRDIDLPQKTGEDLPDFCICSESFGTPRSSRSGQSTTSAPVSGIFIGSLNAGFLERCHLKKFIPDSAEAVRFDDRAACNRPPLADWLTSPGGPTIAGDDTLRDNA